MLTLNKPTDKVTVHSAQKHKSFRDELVHHPIGPVQSGVLSMFMGVSEASVLVKAVTGTLTVLRVGALRVCCRCTQGCKQSLPRVWCMR